MKGTNVSWSVFISTALGCLLLTWFIYRWFFSTRIRKCVLPPGPPVLRGSKEGHLPAIVDCGSLPLYVFKLHAVYGDVVSFYLGQQLCISVGSPDTFRATQRLFDRPRSFFELFLPLLGQQTIQIANGEEGRARHKLYSEPFAHANCNRYTDAIYEASAQLAEQLKRDPVFPAMETFLQFAVGTILKTGFGVDNIDEKKIEKYQNSYNTAWNILESNLLGEKSSTSDELAEAISTMRGMMVEFLEERRKLPEPPNHLFIDVVLEHSPDKETALSDAITMSVGGFHTTGTLLTWLVYYISVYSDVQIKMRNEIQRYVNPDEPDKHDVQQLSYCRAVIDETLRISMLAPYAARVSPQPIYIGSYTIPANTPILQSLGVVLSDKRIWTDPHRFNPDRFLGTRLASHTFVPFGFAGKRVCPGYRFAYMEVCVVMATLLSRFHFTTKDPVTRVTASYGLVTKPKEEIWIRATPL